MLATHASCMQDAAEYYQHLLDVMTRSERVSSERLGSAADTSASPTAAAFQFAIEDRIVCGESGAVSYRRTPANMLSLDIDPAAATNADELEEHRVGLPFFELLDTLILVACTMYSVGNSSLGRQCSSGCFVARQTRHWGHSQPATKLAMVDPIPFLPNPAGLQICRLERCALLVSFGNCVQLSSSCMPQPCST